MAIHQPPDSEPTARARHFDGFFIALLLAVLYGVGCLLSPFSGVLLSALLCVVTFYPVYEFLERCLPKTSPSFRAFLADVLVFVAFIVPTALLAWAVVQESTSLGPVMRQWNHTVQQLRQGQVGNSIGAVRSLRTTLSQTVGIHQAQFQGYVGEFANKILDHISGVGATIAENILAFVFDLLLILFALFFLFRDGKNLFLYFDGLIPLGEDTKDRLMKKAYNTIAGISRGWLLTALVQGIIAMASYLIVGAEGAVLLGALTAVGGLIPGIGTAIIWVPVGIFYLTVGAYVKGVFVLAWGTLAVAVIVDVVLRPYLMGKRTELPFVMLFFSLLGGVEVWGAKGLVIGPILMSLAPLLLDTYRRHYIEKHKNS